MTSLWHRFVEGGDSLRRSAIVQALAHERLRIHALPSDNPVGPGILFFDRISPLLCDQVRAFSRNGLERVLAVALSRSALAGNAVWQLLGSGASDVFSWDHSADPAREIAARFERWESVDGAVESPLVADHLVGSDPGRFRRDLYYRIASWTCKLPPLHDRQGDILPLAQHFLRKLRPNEEPEMDQAVRDYLCQRTYPGNVRDLKQVVSRMSYRHVGPGPLTAGDIPKEERPSIEAIFHDWSHGSFEAAISQAVAAGIGLKEISHTAVDTAIRLAVSSANGNLSRAARQLGVTDRALQMRRAARRKNTNGKEFDEDFGSLADSA